MVPETCDEVCFGGSGIDNVAGILRDNTLAVYPAQTHIENTGARRYVVAW